MAVTQNYSWGRTYESFSQDPDIVSRLGASLVEGIQGDLSEGKIIATAKHFLGDGGTVNGVDQGDNIDTEEELFLKHGIAYLASLEEGVQTVMASFNSWQGNKAHGSKYLLNDVLKEKMGFDGFVISDWNGHGQVKGCSNPSCPQAVNAGIDMFMISKKADWQGFIRNTVAQVENGLIPMERIDDAVRRILRVKMRAGLFNNPTSPLDRPFVKDGSVINSAEHKALAKEAAQKSAVLLKNNQNILPLSKTAKLLVAGSAADDVKYQLGGWSLTWQSNDLNNGDFPTVTSVRKSLEDKLQAGQLVYDRNFSKTQGDSFDAAVVVFGEVPYAEFNGDIVGNKTLEYARAYPEDLALLDSRLKAAGIPTVAVFYSGRPMFTNKELNKSDAFIAAFLPGSEAGPALADLLFGDNNADFSGRLSFPWPNSDCPSEESLLFDMGYGLTLEDKSTVPPLDESNPNSGLGCVKRGGDGDVKDELTFFKGLAFEPWQLKIADASDWQGTIVENEEASQGELVSVAKMIGMGSRTLQNEFSLQQKRKFAWKVKHLRI